uniref:EGF-like domain-containing protein n=1 Tax=Stegastes partitus TaxID=144197 RepID=A0A3B4ZPM1_9TELE
MFIIKLSELIHDARCCNIAPDFLLVVDGFYCLCSPGYAGLRCDGHISSLVCPRCLCSPGWTGVDCAEDVNECDSGPCLNGAQCQESDVPGEFSCTCPPFFSGPLCNQPYDPCDPFHNPCLHNSTCLTRSNGTCYHIFLRFHCICPPGYFGTLFNVDECASNPCQNSGRCIDAPNRFHCLCPDGFTGLHCETNIDECMSAPCLHGSKLALQWHGIIFNYTPCRMIIFPSEGKEAS